MNPGNILRRLSPLIPYVAVGVGVYCLHSAWIALISYHAAMLAVVILGRGSGMGSVTKRRLWSCWILTVALYTAGGIALYAIWPCVWPEGGFVRARLADLGVNRQNWPYFALYFCCLNSLIEELFWRGYLGQDSRRPTLRDAAFAGYHSLVLLAFTRALWAIPVFAGCVFAAWLWRMMRAATGSLVLPVITHLAVDLAIVTAVHLRVFA